jgi:peptide-methionine (S)-S-oxide reductase
VSSGETRSAAEEATLAGGCFWCLEAAYDQLKGVESVESGYTGGHTPKPGYEEVCEGNTGHAEAVRIRFDAAQISYADLLEVFFTIHDPTTLNRQGNDIGSQYRSAIFYHSPAQKATAEELIARLQKARLWGDPIVTEVVPAGTFYEAENYHRQYFERNPGERYCQLVVQPKVAKFRKRFLDKLKV